MSPLMEKLEDGRMLFNTEGLRDYLTDFLCDAAGDAELFGIDAPIMSMFAAVDSCCRDEMIVNMVDALFRDDGDPGQRAPNLVVVYKAIFNMELVSLGHFFYGTHLTGDE